MTRAGHNVITALVMAALVSLPASAQERVTLSALVGNPDQYDGKVIAVTGFVRAYRERHSREADPYTIFHLREGIASVVVIAWPHQGLRDGLRVQVTGTFVKVKTFLFIKAQSTIVLPHRPDPSADWSLRSFSLRGERARPRRGSPLDHARTGPPQGMEEKEPAPDFPRDEELLAHPLAAEVAQPLAL